MVTLVTASTTVLSEGVSRRRVLYVGRSWSAGNIGGRCADLQPTSTYDLDCTQYKGRGDASPSEEEDEEGVRSFLHGQSPWSVHRADSR